MVATHLAVADSQHGTALWREVQGVVAHGRMLLALAADGEAPRGARPRLALTALAARLRTLLWSIGAEPIAEDLIALCVAMELDGETRSLAQGLRGGATGTALTVASLAQALGEEQAPQLLCALAASAPLRRHQLVETGERPGDLLASATVRVTARLVRWLLDPLEVREEIAAYAQLHRPRPRSLLSPQTLATLEPDLQRVFRFLQEGGLSRHLVLRGPRGCGRREIAVEASRRLGRSLLVASIDAIQGQPDPAAAVGALLREAVLLDAQVLVEDWDGPAGSVPARLLGALAASTRTLLLSSSAAEPIRLGGPRGTAVWDVRVPGAAAREEVWKHLLPEVDAAATATLHLGVGAMLRVAEHVKAGADVAAGVRAEFAGDLASVATRVEVSQSWDDLVLPDEVRGSVDELIEQVRHRATVLGRWGFDRKLGRGLGTAALFLGDPGTGKTMVAGLVARALGLDLYQIDLSQIASKWVGETEKNLARVFDAAEVGHVLLLFDEADALLGKRAVDVRSAADRQGNMETNFILQRLEAFRGLAILTSNLESAIDGALSRRLSFQIRFPFPDAAQRAELWRRMIPAAVPLAGEIDFQRLAARFELAGGHIRNVMLRAAYLAAADGALAMAHIERAAESEYRDRGMLASRGRLAR